MGYRARMEMAAHELASVRALLERMHDAEPRELLLERRPLRGGLEAASVARVAARYRDGLGRSRMFPLIIKHLAPAGSREALVYQRFVHPYAGELAPRLLASDSPPEGTAVLYLEALRPRCRWPWRETHATRSVLGLAARLHATRPDDVALAALTGWNYEAELRRTAELTLEQLERSRRQPELARIGLGPTRRIVRALPELRRQLLTGTPLPAGPIHGDLHPGNVMLRRRGGRDQPVLLDWGRARIGSPLEDVSCWLQSLGSWEPEARRRHDTLLAAYVAARGLEPRLGGELRAAYWLAGASNALAGALLYHLTVATDEKLTGTGRARALYAAREWLRILRRADAFWR